MEAFNLGEFLIEIPKPEEEVSVIALGDESQSLLKRLGEESVLWKWDDETIRLFILTDDATAHAATIRRIYNQRAEQQRHNTFVIDIGDTPCDAVGSSPVVLHLKSNGDKYGTVKAFISTIYELIFVHSRITFDWTDLHRFLMNGGDLYIHQQTVADDFSNLDTSFPVLNGHENYYIYYICFHREMGDHTTESINRVADLMEKLPDGADMKWTINVIPEKEHSTVTLLSSIR